MCKIIDYGKYKFDQSKKKPNQQKAKPLKEVKFRHVTEENDYQVKLKNVIKFLNNGSKTKISIRFKGREIAHHDLGKQVLERIEKDVAEFGTVVQRPKLEGRQMVMIINPGKK